MTNVSTSWGGPKSVCVCVCFIRVYTITISPVTDLCPCSANMCVFVQSLSLLLKTCVTGAVCACVCVRAELILAQWLGSSPGIDAGFGGEGGRFESPVMHSCTSSHLYQEMWCWQPREHRRLCQPCEHHGGGEPGRPAGVINNPLIKATQVIIIMIKILSVCVFSTSIYCRQSL